MFNDAQILAVAIEQVTVGAGTIGEMAGIPIAELGVVYKETESGTPATHMGTRAAERMRMITQEAFGDNCFVINEELGTAGNPNSELVCFEDPDDGSSKMLVYRPGDVLPVTGVTYVREGQTIVTAYGDIAHNQIVYATKEGAFSRPFSLGDPSRITRGPARPHNKSFAYIDALMNQFTIPGAAKMLPAIGKTCMNIRTEASCLLHLGYLAMGICDVVVIHAMSGFWDIGILMACQATGCRVTDIHGNDIHGPGPGRDGSYPFLLGTAPGINHEQLLEAAQSAFGRDYAGFRGPDYGK